MTTTTDPRSILAQVLGHKIPCDDGSKPTVADVLPEELASKAKAACERTPRRIYSVVLCSECEAVFTHVAIDLDGTMLPCGHKAARWMVASCIHDGQAAEDFIHWAVRKDLLDRAMNHLTKRGGKYDLSHNGPGGFVRPPGDRL